MFFSAYKRDTYQLFSTLSYGKQSTVKENRITILPKYKDARGGRALLLVVRRFALVAWAGQYFSVKVR